MAARAVHVDEVNPEKSAPLGGDAGGDKKVEALDLQGLPSGGDSWTRTNGRASLGRLTQAPLARAPHDVNDVLWLCGRVCNKIMKPCSNR